MTTDTIDAPADRPAAAPPAPQAGLDLSRIAQDLQIRKMQVESVVQLLDEGNTVPFITRYRKERTGGLDEEYIRRIQFRVGQQRALVERKATILKSIEQQGRLSPELREAIEAADHPKRLEDLYLPYKPKKRTLASDARDKGLEPFAAAVWGRDPLITNVAEFAGQMIDAERGLNTADDIVQGAKHILAELVAENADVRGAVRRVVWESGRLAVTKSEKVPEGKGLDFKDYFAFGEGVKVVPPHRILAINRGEKEGVLNVKLQFDTEGAQRLAREALPIADHPHRDFLFECIDDAMSRLLVPSLEREVRRELTERAQDHAIHVFARNLRSLLMQPPLRGKRVLAIDPGFRTGCKVAALDETGALLDHGVVFPHQPQKRSNDARAKLRRYICKHQLTVVAIGNGTACRETEELVAGLIAELEARRNGTWVEPVAADPPSRPPTPPEPATWPKGEPAGDAPPPDAPFPGDQDITPQPPVENPPAKRNPQTTDTPVEEGRGDAGVATAENQVLAVTLAPPPVETHAMSGGESAATLPTASGDNVPPLDQPEAVAAATDGGPGDAGIASAENHTLSVSLPPPPVETHAAPPTSPPPPLPSLSGDVMPALDSPEVVSAAAADTAPVPSLAGDITPADAAAHPPEAPPPMPAVAAVAPAAPEEPLPDAPADLAYVIVNEAGASDYSASPVGKEEFPSFDATLRGTISIGRRLQDPLSELVKIDPQHVGVGLYQHDVPGKHLKESLEAIIESCVNNVGIDLNTASVPLLRHVSGLNAMAARELVEYRTRNGRFTRREQLQEVTGIGAARYTQAAGFLKIPDGDHPLDSTWIHPENYELVERFLGSLGLAPDAVRDPAKRQEMCQAFDQLDIAAAAGPLGLSPPALADIMNDLARPGRDPREDLPPPIFKKDVLKIEDLQAGMELKGTVLNVVDFGAFIDIGLKDSGLVHISQLANRFIKNPHEVVAVGDVVSVWVMGVDGDRKRVSLTMIAPGSDRKPQERERGPRPQQGQRPPRPQGDRGQQSDAPLSPGDARPVRDGGGQGRFQQRGGGGGRPGGPPQRGGSRPGGGRPNLPPHLRPRPEPEVAADAAPPPPRRPQPPKALPNLTKEKKEGKAYLNTLGELEAFFKSRQSPPEGS